jgi:hypothetical protein
MPRILSTRVGPLSIDHEKARELGWDEDLINKVVGAMQLLIEGAKAMHVIKLNRH